jgi:hypothetical protein
MGLGSRRAEPSRVLSAKTDALEKELEGPACGW